MGVQHEAVGCQVLLALPVVKQLVCRQLLKRACCKTDLGISPHLDSPPDMPEPSAMCRERGACGNRTLPQRASRAMPCIGVRPALGHGGGLGGARCPWRALPMVRAAHGTRCPEPRSPGSDGGVDNRVGAVA